MYRRNSHYPMLGTKKGTATYRRKVFLTYTRHCEQKANVIILKSTLKIPPRHNGIIPMKIKGHTIKGHMAYFISDQDSKKGRTPTYTSSMEFITPMTIEPATPISSPCKPHGCLMYHQPLEQLPAVSAALHASCSVILSTHYKAAGVLDQNDMMTWPAPWWMIPDHEL